MLLLGLSDPSIKVGLSVSCVVSIDRYRKGERHGRAKLTWEQVNWIRQAYGDRLFSQQELARFFEVSQMEVSRIVTRKIWLSGSSLTA